MAKPRLEDLRPQADEIYSTYTSNFAGKPRATRDLSLLRDLISRLASLIEETRTLMNGDRNPAVLAFLETATDNLERYRKEESAIKQAQTDPHAIESATLANRANRVFDAYQRHFAGEDRATRDRMLLHEMVGELEHIQRQMRDLVQRGGESVRGDLGTVSSQLQMYKDEVTNIARAQTVGTQDDVSSRLAQLANSQFALYSNHFAGKSRTSRRPALLQRMIDNLEEYRAEMQELVDDGFTSEMNRNNISIVDTNLEMYRNELREIQKAREETTVADLAGALGGAANDVFNEYRDNFAGQDRKTRNLDLISTLCDRLRDIALQMREIEEAIDLDTNTKNLQIVEERWATYEAEYRRIKEAKGIA